MLYIGFELTPPVYGAGKISLMFGSDVFKAAEKRHPKASKRICTTVKEFVGTTDMICLMTLIFSTHYENEGLFI